MIYVNAVMELLKLRFFLVFSAAVVSPVRKEDSESGLLSDDSSK